MTERRPASSKGDARHELVGLPARPFLYTLDQIASLLELKQETLEDKHVFFQGRSIGVPLRAHLKAHNIASASDKPDWRIPDREFIRWMKYKGFKYYDVGTFGS